MRIITSILLLSSLTLGISSCNYKTSKVENEEKTSPINDSTNKQEIKSISIKSKPINELQKDSSTIDIIENKVLLPSSYRYLDDSERISKKINPDWFAIYFDGKSYQLGKIKYSIQEEPQDECSGMFSESIKSDYNTIAYLHIKDLKAKSLDTINFQKPIINGNENSVFQWKGSLYNMVGFGRNLEDLTAENKASYKLNLYKDNKFIKTLINQHDYVDTHTSLIMITDLDGDNEPDFIFSSPRHYEEERLLIILSSQDGTYEGNVIFDC